MQRSETQDTATRLAPRTPLKYYLTEQHSAQLLHRVPRFCIEYGFITGARGSRGAVRSVPATLSRNSMLVNEPVACDARDAHRCLGQQERDAQTREQRQVTQQAHKHPAVL